jgi:hypothetical protein
MSTPIRRQPGETDAQFLARVREALKSTRTAVTIIGGSRHAKAPAREG